MADISRRLEQVKEGAIRSEVMTPTGIIPEQKISSSEQPQTEKKGIVQTFQDWLKKIRG